jgi:hypothetical protein
MSLCGLEYAVIFVGGVAASELGSDLGLLKAMSSDVFVMKRVNFDVVV